MIVPVSQPAMQLLPRCHWTLNVSTSAHARILPDVTSSTLTANTLINNKWETSVIWTYLRCNTIKLHRYWSTLFSVSWILKDSLMLNNLSVFTDYCTNCKVIKRYFLYHLNCSAKSEFITNVITVRCLCWTSCHLRNGCICFDHTCCFCGPTVIPI